MTKPFIIKCVDCKKEFNENDLTYKRICDVCRKQRQINAKKRLRADNKISEYCVTCKFCKNDFLSYSKTRKYCSDTCRQKYHNIPDIIKYTEKSIDKLTMRVQHLRIILG